MKLSSDVLLFASYKATFHLSGLAGLTSRFFKRNARVLRTGSRQNGPAHGSEPLSSPASVGQSAGICSQFLIGTHKFSELVLSRMALLMDQSRFVLLLRSANELTSTGGN